MIKQRKIQFLAATMLAFLVVSGCDSPETRVDLAAELKDLPPFDRMETLVLPSRVDELAKIRPSADSTDFGLSERVDGAEVDYFGDRSTRYDVPVRKNAAVRHVLVSFQPITGDSAAHLWSELISRLRLRAGVKPACFSHPALGPGRRIALQPFHRGVIYMRGDFSDSVPEGPEKRLDSVVRIGVALDSSVARPLLESSKEIPCDSLDSI